jgi:hypothetical protein
VKTSGRILSGHSVGANAVWLSALNAPDDVVCVAPVSGAADPAEAPGRGDSFFRLDVGSSHIDSGT